MGPNSCEKSLRMVAGIWLHVSIRPVEGLIFLPGTAQMWHIGTGEHCKSPANASFLLG